MTHQVRRWMPVIEKSNLPREDWDRAARALDEAFSTVGDGDHVTLGEVWDFSKNRLPLIFQAPKC